MTHCHAGLETCISLQSNCWILHLNSIYVPGQVTHLHPSPEIFVSIPSSSLYYHLNSIQVTYHLHPGPKNLNLTITLVPRFASQTYPGPASDRSMAGCISPHIDPIWPLSRSWYQRLTSIQLPRFASQLHPGQTHLRPCPEACIAPLSMSLELHHNSTYVIYYLNPAPETCISTTCMAISAASWDLPITPSMSCDLLNNPINDVTPHLQASPKKFHLNPILIISSHAQILGSHILPLP